MQDNFNIREWQLKQAINELEEKKLCKECGAGYMEEGQCMECGYMGEGKFYSRDYVDQKYGNKAKEIEDNIQDEEDNNPNIWDLYTSLETPEEVDDFVQGYMNEATFTSKHDDDPKLKGGQKDLPDEVQAGILKKEATMSAEFNDNDYSESIALKLVTALRKAGFDNDKIRLVARAMMNMPSLNEGEDHEVSMAQNSLKSIISSASQLMNKLGNDERDILGWIQDHITNAENYIEQAAQGFHELDNKYEED